MSLTLNKGQTLSLNKDAGFPEEFIIGLGWDVSRTKTKYDLDLIVLMLKSAKEKVVQQQSNGKPGVIYFGDKASYCGSIKLDKDNRDGSGDGYDENVYMNLETVPLTVNCLPVCINIYQGVELGQTFGQVENAFIEVNVEGLPPLKVDLTEDHAAATLVHVADLYRGDDGVWKLKKIEFGIESGFAGLMTEYGVPTQ